MKLRKATVLALTASMAAALAARRFLGGGSGGAAGLPFAARYRIMEERYVWKGRLSCGRSFS